MKASFHFLLLFILVTSSCDNGIFNSGKNDFNGEFKPTSEFDFEVEGYINFNVEGFHVLLEDQLNELGSDVSDDILSVIQQDLNIVLNLDFNKEIISMFKSVRIFVDKESTSGAAYYAPKIKEYTPDSIFFPTNGGIVISNIGNYRAWSIQNQPFIMLHELAHAYHDQVLDFDNQLVFDAYNNAIDNGLYKYVLYNGGYGNIFTQEFAYAHGSHIEFFAEVTEAYFGRNDYYPFDYNDLQVYDSLTFSMIETVWEQNGDRLDKSILSRTNTFYSSSLTQCKFH